VGNRRYNYSYWLSTSS